MKEQQLIELLEKVLGATTLTRDGDEALFYCPKCNHHKKKLSVNVHTQKFQCWVCGYKGGRVSKILKQKQAAPQYFTQLQEINKLYNFKTNLKPLKSEEHLSLPNEFKPLYPLTSNPTHIKAVDYLIKQRNLTPIDILKYSIGYCDRGIYKDMIIFPSYDCDGNLNYFVGRSFIEESYIKHRQPKGADKDMIGFDFHVNWDLPVIICESPLDAISIKRNSIPLFGKKIHEQLMGKLISSSTKDIYLALDSDALKNALTYAEKLIGYGKNVYVINFGEKDPNELGFENILPYLHTAQQITYSDIIKQKLSLLH